MSRSKHALRLATSLAAVMLTTSACGTAAPITSPSSTDAASRTPVAPSPAASAPTVLDDAVRMYKGGPGRTGEMHGPPIREAPAELWTVDLGGPVISSPAIADGTAYLPTATRELIAVDVVTGAVKWRYQAHDAINSSPAVANGLVIANDDAGAMLALDVAGGALRWTAERPVAPDSMPLVLDGTVYAGTPEGSLLGFDLASGKTIFESHGGGDLFHAVAADADRLFAGSRDGSMYAFDRRTSQRTWAFPGDARDGYTTPAVRDDRVITVGHKVGGSVDMLLALDAATGMKRWDWSAPEGVGLYAPSVDGHAVYDASTTGDLRAFDPATGTVLWTKHLGGYMRPSPAIVDGSLIVFGGDDEVFGVDAVDGDVLWSQRLDGTVEYGTSFAEGRLVAVTMGGSAIAIGPESLKSATASGSVPPSASPPRSASATPAPLLTVVATMDEPPGGLGDPTGLAEDPMGRIWIADGIRHGFAIFDRDGHFVEHWGTHGSGPGQFDFDNANSGNNTADIRFTTKGDFYVADTGNFRIQHFSADRRLLGAWGGFGQGNGKFAIPFSIALDDHDNVYVTSGNGDVQVFDRDGTYLRTIGRQGSGDGELLNAGIAIEGDRLYVADFENHRIAVFGTDGTFVANWAAGQLPGDPNALAVGDDGRLYVTAGGRMVVLSDDGAILGSYLPDGSGPVFVIALADGRIATTEWHQDPPGPNEVARIYRSVAP